MILVDFSQIFIAAAMVDISRLKEKVDISVDMVRHMSLNSLRMYNQKFKRDYGEMVLAIDSKHSWRKDFFPNYKCRRSINKNKSIVDWNALYSGLETVVAEIKEFFPYRVIQLEGMEGDDIIAALCHSIKEPIVIISDDHDMKQLMLHKNVSIYQPRKETLITH